jgi:succinyl-diaminopimelate desuccinylase
VTSGPAQGSRDALVATLLDLLAIPSVTAEERALCDHVQARLQRRFARTVRANDSVVAGQLEDDGRPLLVLLGHLDTVPGDTRPGRVDGERVYGLGASDMKSGLAVMLELADRLPDDGPTRLAFAFYSFEETDYDLSGLPELLQAAPSLLDAALGVCLEPTDGELHLGCVGSLHARLTVRGRNAHSARPWQGDNAIYKALPLLQDLAAVRPTDVVQGGLTFRNVTTVTQAEAGGGRNVVPGLFELNVNVRFAPGGSQEEAEAELGRLVDDRAEITIVDGAPSAPVPVGNPLLDRLGAGLTTLPKQAWTDVARLAQAGIPACNLGPGETGQAHQPGEWCEIEPMVAIYERLAALAIG